jgi:hypothetical protein
MKGPEKIGPGKSAESALKEEWRRGEKEEGKRGEKEERELLVLRDTMRTDGNTVPDAKRAVAKDAVKRTCSASTATSTATSPETATMVPP